MADIEQLTQRILDTVVTIARTAKTMATGLLLGSGFFIIASFAILLAVSSGSTRTLIAIVGAVAAIIGIGAAALARWRFSSVERHVPELADEVRALLSEQDDSGRGRFVEAFLADDDGNLTTVTEDGREVVVSPEQRRERGFFDSLLSWRGVRGVVGEGMENYGRITNTIASVTSFAPLALTAIGVAAGFSVIAFIGVLVAIFS